jgi:uncharacterized protein
MSTVVVGSTRPGAGKTSLVLGLTRAIGKACGYIKPLGDRLMYKKKRLWDYDAAVAATVLKLEHNPEDITIGFEHAKLTFMYDESSTRAKLREMASKAGSERRVVFVEAGRDVHYGASVHLDPISMARSLDARLLLVASGDPETVLDDVTFLWHYAGLGSVPLAGLVVNQVKDVPDFETTYLVRLKALGVPVLGVVPFDEQLTYRSLRQISEILFGKVIAGEENANRVVKHVLIGATSVAEAITRELTRREGALIITSGDRSDVILAALQANAVGIVLTNNYLPAASIVAQASRQGTPLVLVTADTFQAAKVVDSMEPLTTAEDTEKLAILADLVRQHVDVSGF